MSEATRFSQLEAITAGQILQLAQDRVVSHLLTDSRKLVIAPGALFFAIKGPHHDGHQFIATAYDDGIRLFIIEQEKFDTSNYPEASFLVVKNAILALQQIAGHHRQQYDYPVLAITGSNGKTIVKEWLSTMLEESWQVVKSPKSYNSQIGVPLSLWLMNDHYNLAIIEAGISQMHEMDRLEKIIQPGLGIFTNIGPAHNQGFPDLETKIREKARLFRGCDKIIYRKHHSLIDQILRDQFPTERLMCWSTEDEKADFYFKSLGHQQYRVTGMDGKLHVKIPFDDPASLENCMHAIVASKLFNLTPAEIQSGVMRLNPLDMRLTLKPGINGCSLIDDSYSNDLASLAMALDFMGQQQQAKSKTVILSDMLETGMTKADRLAAIAQLLKDKGVSKLIGIGEEMMEFVPGGEIIQFTYKDTNDFLQRFNPADFQQELILIKGSRVFEFEKIVARLQQKHHRTSLEVNLDAITHNLNVYRSKVAPETKMMVMVKAFAYGGGSHEIGSLLQYHGVDYLGVAYVDEGVELRQHGIHIPIMVMNPPRETFQALVDYDLEPEIYSLQQLEEFLSFFSGKPTPPLHLKLETGMNRLGFGPTELKQALPLLQNLQIATAFSHLAASEADGEEAFTHQQAQKFLEMTTLLEKTIDQRPIRHLVNSAGIIHYPQYHFDMVRLGIGLYGVDSYHTIQAQLESVGTLKSTISQIKKLEVGDTVGYGRAFKATANTEVATVAIGYADGYDRRFGNGVGSMMINNRIAPVVGNVCMDMTMIDVTGIKCREGDEVIIFGEQLPIFEAAARIGTIPYEMLTGIGSRVKRVFYSN